MLKYSKRLLLLLVVSAIFSGGCGDPYRPVIVETTSSHDVAVSSLPRRPSPPAIPAPAPEFSPEWIPPRGSESPGRWQGILIHHSATAAGSAAYIDRLHKDRGWDGLGYHFVINNGTGGADGQIEVGWRWRQQREGAHCRLSSRDDNYYNEHTIGICLIGNFENTSPTPAQYESLARLTRFLQNRYNIPTSRIQGHGDVANTKCPGEHFSWWRFRSMLR